MIIHGLQKMTLLDYPGKVACTVFLGGCDFRCPFCHNWELLDGSAPAETDDEGLLKFLKTRQGLLDGVAITGGEPLLRPDLPQLLEKIRELGFAIKLDTNGNHPDRLQHIVDAGLVDYIAMDVKNSLEKYGKTIGVDDPDLGPVRESVSLLLKGKTEYEFRTTVVKELHDEASFYGIREWIAGAEKHYLQKFTDRDTVPFQGLHAPEENDLKLYAAIMKKTVREVGIRG